MQTIGGTQKTRKKEKRRDLVSCDESRVEKLIRRDEHIGAERTLEQTYVAYCVLPLTTNKLIRAHTQQHIKFAPGDPDAFCNGGDQKYSKIAQRKLSNEVN